MSSYIIWNPASRLPPTVIHPSRPKAIQIAGKMAAENPGESFYVCKLTNVAKRPAAVSPPVEYTDLDKVPLSCPF